MYTFPLPPHIRDHNALFIYSRWLLFISMLALAKPNVADLLMLLLLMLFSNLLSLVVCYAF